MEKKVLAVLKEYAPDFVSAEVIGERLGLEPRTVEDIIADLRDVGYDIPDQPHLGYRLCRVPDRWLPDEISLGLKTNLLGKKVLSYYSTGSTNDLAVSLAEQGAEEGTLVIAETQTAGRGRFKRCWSSPAFRGLYASLVLRPPVSADKAGCLTLLAANAVAAVIRECCALEALIKWPNDIMVNGKKVCGILTETGMNGSQSLKFLVLGIGLNINANAKELPPEAGSLRLFAGRKIDRLDLLGKLLLHLEKRYKLWLEIGAEAVISEWRDLSLSLGKRVEVNGAEGVLAGQAMDVDNRGALMIRDDFGRLHSVLAGEVTVIK